MIVRLGERVLTIVDAPKEYDAFDYLLPYNDYLVEEGMITDANKITARPNIKVLEYNKLCS